MNELDKILDQLENELKTFFPLIPKDKNKKYKAAAPLEGVSLELYWLNCSDLDDHGEVSIQKVPAVDLVRDDEKGEYRHLFTMVFKLEKQDFSRLSGALREMLDAREALVNLGYKALPGFEFRRPFKPGWHLSYLLRKATLEAFYQDDEEHFGHGVKVKNLKSFENFVQSIIKDEIQRMKYFGNAEMLMYLPEKLRMIVVEERL